MYIGPFPKVNLDWTFGVTTFETAYTPAVAADSFLNGGCIRGSDDAFHP